MRIELGDDNTVSVTHHGLVDATQGYEIDALYTPTFRLSLFSINQLDSAGSTATFGGGKCSISSPQSLITITGHRVNDLYIISPTASAHTASTLDALSNTPLITVPSTLSSTDSSSISKSTRRKRTRSTLTTESMSQSPTTPPSAPPHSSPSPPAISSPNAPLSALLSTSPSTPAISSLNAPRSTPTTTSRSPPIAATKSKSTRKTLTISQSRLWHRCFAHMQPASVRSLIPEYTNDDLMCTVCIQAKHKQKFIRAKVKRTTKPFELVHSDVCGPFSTPTFGGNKHFILFVDDYTRFTFVWMLPDKKSETCTTAYKAFQARVHAMGQGYQIKQFRCDNGRGSTTTRPSARCSLPAVRHMNRARLTLNTRMESLRE